jgi:hypothetical protein
MSTIRTLNPDRVSLLGLRSHLTYSISRFKAEPLATSHVAPFDAYRAKWDLVHLKELVLNDELTEAQAQIDSCDKLLNELASRCSKIILTITKDNREHSLYTHFFGDESLSDFKRPVLGEQLQAMRGWIGLLEASEHPSLKALGPDLEPVVKAADDAVKAKANVEQKKKLFREDERRKLFDEVNAARKSAHGELAKLPHIHTGLPASFADGFFRQESARGETEEIEEPQTIASVELSIASLKQKLAAEEALLAELLAQKELEAKVEADRAALAAIEKAMAEQAAQAAALKAKIAAAAAGTA